MVVRRLLLVAFLLVAAPADAATVAVERSPPPCDRGCSEELTVRFVAAPGELNDLAVRVDDSRVWLRDDGATIVVGTGCSATTRHEALCVAGPLARIHVETGDGADRVSGPDGAPGADRTSFSLGPGDDLGSWTGVVTVGASVVPTGRLYGGPGDDVLTLHGRAYADGGPGGDRVAGSADDDVVKGGGGRDELSGSGGHDVLSDDDGAAADADVLDGGEGVDTVVYSDRSQSVTVDLAAQEVAGQAGEGDRLAGFERVAGGRADDVLSGTGGPELLHGGPGADALDGRGGDDRLEGGDGPDAIAGGDGADHIEGGSASDAIDGGPGSDPVLVGGGGADRVAGGDGDDVLNGGEGLDVLDAGAGDDALDGIDYIADSLLCGEGADRASFTRGDALESCETLDERRLAPLLEVFARRWGRPALELRRRRVPIRADCFARQIFECSGTFSLRVGRRRVAAFAFRCDVCTGPMRGREVRLPRWLVRRVERRGRVAAQSVIALGSGIGRAGIPVVEDVWIVK